MPIQYGIVLKGESSPWDYNSPLYCSSLWVQPALEMQASESPEVNGVRRGLLCWRLLALPMNLQGDLEVASSCLAIEESAQLSCEFLCEAPIGLTITVISKLEKYNHHARNPCSAMYLYLTLLHLDD